MSDLETHAAAAEPPPAPQPPAAADEHPVGLGTLYRALWEHAAGARPLLLYAFLLLLASQLFKLAVPWLAGNAINQIQAGGLEGMSEAGRWLGMVFAAIVASWLLHGPGRILERNVALKVRERLAALLVGRLLAAPLAWHERHHSGETTHRMQQSTHALYDFAQSQFIYLQNTVRLVGPIVALWLISPLVGAVALVGYGLIGLLITRFDRVMMRVAVEENRAERAYSATLVDVLGNVLSVLALRRGEGVARLIGERLAAVFGPLKKSIVLNEAKWCSVDLLASALWCVLVGVYAAEAAGVFGFGAAAGGAAAAAGTIALGKVFMVYEYSQQAGGVITAIAAHFQSLARQRADYAAAAPLLSAAPAPRPADGEDIAASAWARWAWRGCASPTATAAPARSSSTAWRSCAAGATPWSARAVRARPPCCACSPGWMRPRRGPCRSMASPCPWRPPWRSPASRPPLAAWRATPGAWPRCLRACAISPP